MTTLQQNLRPEPLHAAVARELMARVMGGHYKPGDLLPIEPKLVTEFGVSRTVIREAVRSLNDKGIITVRQGSGMRVEPPDQWSYLDPVVLFELVKAGRSPTLFDELLEGRRILEVQLVGLAASKRTDEDVQGLADLLAQMREHVRDPDPAEYNNLDLAFHELIARAARNRLLFEAMRPITEITRIGRFYTVSVSGGLELSLRGHDELYQAVRLQDVGGAQQAMLHHVQQFETNIRDTLHRQGETS
ncbi:FadR/GntR family transcriptional regulator [Deinococcus marmoris]|uniref:Transcriptional regulator, GntR family n=1 Tax=Deinococcus marmoris TaxID=249408 RepID=A0A1U7P126_9DEIO|nr:FadR/GntR family transcriptional regulator [Deinococcus marmoris]OLV18860.1 Transcriptional regulator, GntR family [Deinococcus marmoris]